MAVISLKRKRFRNWYTCSIEDINTSAIEQ